MINLSYRYNSEAIKIPNNFIVLCGLDGAGKSTQARLLKSSLENIGYSCFVKHHRISENEFFYNTFKYIYNSQIRRNIQQNETSYIVAFEYLGYFINNIIPLTKNYIPILDRGVFDLLASQTTIFGNNFDSGWILLNEIACSGCHIFIDVLPEICCDRINKRTEKPKPHESLEALQMKYKVYKQQVEVGALISVNGQEEKESVNENILKHVRMHLSKR